MITSFVITSGVDAAAYHDKAFTQDGNIQKADNYYLSEGADARWLGQGAEILGISGQKVERSDYIDMLEGRIKNPATGEIQDLSKNGKERRAGYDFQFAAPKSVSLVALVGGDTRVYEAFLKANDAAMSWWEKHAAQIRVKQDGANAYVNSGNLLYARIVHESSRANDPQLHAHNNFMAISYDKDAKKWRSLTNDEMMRTRMAADRVGMHSLSVQLQKLGYELELGGKNGAFEIKGISREQIDGFSIRSQQMKAALAAVGKDRDSAAFALRAQVALDTRDKKKEYPREVLTTAWDMRGKELGLDISSIVTKAKERSVDLAQVSQSSMQVTSDALKVVGMAITHLTANQQVFKRSELEEQAIRFASGKGVEYEQIQAAIKNYEKGKDLLEREVPKAPEGTYLTTRRAVDMEEQLLGYVSKGRGNGRVVLSSESEFNDAVKVFNEKMTAKTGEAFELSPEQVRAAKNILMHPDNYQVIQGEAGTGKTAALAFVKDVAESKGWTVIGMATAGSAAEELEHSSGIKSSTVASFLVQQENKQHLLSADLAALRQAERAAAIGVEKPLERAVQNNELQNVKFGRTDYSYDKKTSEIYASAKGRFNVKAVMAGLGFHLTNWESKTTHSLSQKPTNDQEQLSHQAKVLGATLVGKLGRAMRSFESVGHVEGIAARAAMMERHSHESGRDVEIEKVKAQIQNLQNTGTTTGSPILFVMDEASLTGIEDALKVAKIADQIGARVVPQGDTRQHSSVPAGRMFDQIQKAGANVSILKETRRFKNADRSTRRAITLMKYDEYSRAMEQLNHVDAKSDGLVATAAEHYFLVREKLLADGKAVPLIGVVTPANKDRKELNSAIQKGFQDRGIVGQSLFKKEHFDMPKVSPTEKTSTLILSEVGVNRILFNKSYREIGVTKGSAVKITKFDHSKNLISGVLDNGRTVKFNPARQDFFKAAILEQRQFGAGDAVETRSPIHKNEEHDRVSNSKRGIIQSIDDLGAVVTWKDGQTHRLTNAEMRVVEFSYSHTSFKEQGATNDRELFVVGKGAGLGLNREAAYVAGTRAKLNIELVTDDRDWVIKNADRVVDKLTAIDLDQSNPWKVLDGEMKLTQILAARAQEEKQALAPEENQHNNKQDLAVINTPDRAMEKANAELDMLNDSGLER